MSYSKPMLANEDGRVEYTVKKTEGTYWAEKFLAQSYKRYSESGQHRLMLVPPPLSKSKHHAR